MRSAIKIPFLLTLAVANAFVLPDDLDTSFNAAPNIKSAGPASVLRPTAPKLRCSEKPFEFFDLTTDTCASCGLICGAGGLPRSEWCSKEPNCQGNVNPHTSDHETL